MDFYNWVHANKNKFKKLENLFQPFLNVCLTETDISLLESKKQIHSYLSINGYSDETVFSFYRVWYCYEKEKNK